ncbi:MAG: hypothetical protein KF774_18690 [Planctomyces sp.]|nr:hypothetical protein [Planctomyces sp.]
MSSASTPRAVYITTAVLGVLILVPSLLGFINKLIEFAHVARGETEGLFALTPMMNYVLASLGFFCLLLWAALQGMFRDIEGPKQTMLERERLLDRPDDAFSTNP